MRELCGHRPGEIVEFVPTSFGNLDADDPIRIWYESPTEHQRRKLLAAGAKYTVGKDGSVVTSGDDHVDRQARVISGLVKQVENYVGRAGPITNGEELADHGDTMVLNEVFVELTTVAFLSPGQKKKSDGPSGSKEQSKSEQGTAENA